MTTPQGLATFPGIAQVISGSITLSPGISPSVARLSIVPQASFPSATGTLSFSCDGQTVELVDCKIDRTSYARSDSGEVTQLSLVDRRWKWRFGAISGRYNIRREDGSLQDGGSEGQTIDTERTPRELAELYLDAMGENDYDASELPNDSRPSVDHDFDNPAEALARLCDRLGCQIVLRLDNTVALVPIGSGGELPDELLLEDSATPNPPELPDKVAVLCGPSVYQVDFQLETVGIDVDTDGEGQASETIKPINALSYCPTEGWSSVDLPFFMNVGTGTDETDVTGLRSLAIKSVFRHYRIITPIRVPGYGDGDELVEKLEQLLPLSEEQVVTARENHQAVPLPATVFGVWYPALDDLENSAETLEIQGNSPPAAGPGEKFKSPFYNRGFKIDTARGLVIFDEPVYRNTTPTLAKLTVGPAQLVLRAKCQVRDADSLAESRHVHERSTGSEHGTGTLYLRHEELVMTHVPQYHPDYYDSPVADGIDPREILSVTTNESQIANRCDEFIDAALAEFVQSSPRQVRVIGIVPTNLDGQIGQVTYEIGPSGATTTIARESEPSSFAISQAERRRAQMAQQYAALAERFNSPAGTRQMRREAALRRRSR